MIIKFLNILRRGISNMDDVFNLQTIDEKVEELLEKCKIIAPPVDIEEICRRNNISIYSGDLSGLEKNAKRPISGALLIKDKTKTIYTNNKENLKRQRFTIAHELGHYFIEKKKEGDEVISISFRGLYNPDEREVDEFAAKLLMPTNMVINEHRKMLYPIVSHLADIFMVSKPAMSRRLNELELDFIDL